MYGVLINFASKVLDLMYFWVSPFAWKAWLELFLPLPFVIDFGWSMAIAEDRASRGNSRNRHRRVSTNQATNNGDIHIDLEGHSCPKVQSMYYILFFI